MPNPLAFHSSPCCSIHQPLWKLYQRGKCSLYCFGSKSKLKDAHKTKSNCLRSVLTARKHSRGQISWNDKEAQKISPKWYRLISVQFAVLVSCPCAGGARGQIPALSPCCVSPSWGWHDSPRAGCLARRVSWGQWILVTMLDVSIVFHLPVAALK